MLLICAVVFGLHVDYTWHAVAGIIAQKDMQECEMYVYQCSRSQC